MRFERLPERRLREDAGYFWRLVSGHLIAPLTPFLLVAGPVLSCITLLYLVLCWRAHHLSWLLARAKLTAFWFITTYITSFALTASLMLSPEPIQSTVVNVSVVFAALSFSFFLFAAFREFGGLGEAWAKERASAAHVASKSNGDNAN